jgi:transmembrane sensor
MERAGCLQYMEHQQARDLLAKYRAGNCTPAELGLLEQWYGELELVPFSAISETEMTADLDAVFAALPVAKRVVFWPKLVAAAAAVLLMIGAGLYFSRPAKSVYYANDIAPGGNKAILTLANGKRISLADARNGQITNGVTKADGRLRYDTASVTSGFNTLSTPAGGQYEVILPDGTKAWLNAVSSLRYPASFTGRKERTVELTGEAYFEVVHDKNIPFKVITARQVTEDIGTQFNINAYEPAIRTTLLEGSIKVNGQLLRPGQQALLAGKLTIGAVDTEAAIAWKNGYFRFNNEPITSIMAQLARWYTIEVNYSGRVSAEGFYGAISRNKPISEVLGMLEQTKGVHFKIEGRRVTVFP